MHSGSGRIALKQNSAVSVYIGIASLVLEGRVISTDEDDDDAFSKKFESTIDQPQFPDEKVADSCGQGSSSSRQGVIHRISEKLMRLRQFPGSKEVVETTIAIPTSSGDDCDYERQPRLHHLASTREFQRNQRLTTVPSSSASNSSSAASVLHDIDVDWNDISFVFNGLDNLPGSPMKLSANHHFRSSLGHPIQLQQEQNLNLFKSKEKLSAKAATKSKQGPHCEKFLKKIGLLKAESSELENDHMCNHVSGYVSLVKLDNVTVLINSFRFQCRRWQFHLKMLLQILSKGEDACIEIYLGPENNAILLEQWTFQLTNK